MKNTILGLGLLTLAACATPRTYEKAPTEPFPFAYTTQTPHGEVGIHKEETYVLDENQMPTSCGFSHIVPITGVVLHFEEGKQVFLPEEKEGKYMARHGEEYFLLNGRGKILSSTQEEIRLPHHPLAENASCTFDGGLEKRVGLRLLYEMYRDVEEYESNPW